MEVSTGHAVLWGRRVAIVDTPGAASFVPSSEDERVTRDILLDGPPQNVVVVGDAKNLERTLLLAVQVAEMGIPFVLCLNMMDEARARGMAVNEEELAERLGVPVVSTVAVRREGIARLIAALERPRPGQVRIVYPEPVERAVESVVPLLPQARLSARSLALMALSGDVTLSQWLSGRMTPESLDRLEQVRQGLRRQFPEPVAYVVNRARLAEASRIGRSSAPRPAPDERPRRRFGRLLDTATTHRIWGLPVLAAVLYLSYLFVGVFGAKTLVDLLENGLFGKIHLAGRHRRGQPLDPVGDRPGPPGGSLRHHHDGAHLLARARAADRRHVLSRLRRARGFGLPSAPGRDGEPPLQEDGVERQGGPADGARARLRHDGDDDDAHPRDAARSG